jgi:hypothetical protein
MMTDPSRERDPAIDSRRGAPTFGHKANSSSYLDSSNCGPEVTYCPCPQRAAG